MFITTAVAVLKLMGVDKTLVAILYIYVSFIKRENKSKELKYRTAHLIWKKVFIDFESFNKSILWENLKSTSLSWKFIKKNFKENFFANIDCIDFLEYLKSKKNSWIKI